VKLANVKKKISIMLGLALVVLCVFQTPLLVHAADPNADRLTGQWERFGDAGEGSIVNVQKVGDAYQATLQKVTGTLIDLGFAVGDLKWKDVVWRGDTNYTGMDMFRFQDGGYEYRNSALKINSQGILEVGVSNGDDTTTNVIIGTYQTWRKIAAAPTTTVPDNTTPTRQIVLQIQNKYMTVNGLQKEIDPGKGTAPVILNGRTILPIRAIAEELGGTVSWDANQSKVTINLNSKTLELWIGRNATLVNGSEVQTDVAPQIMNGRTMIPLRYVVENLGYDVAWNGDTKTVTITY
jgi:hypothetical protein